jgi:hypothetical protein
LFPGTRPGRDPAYSRGRFKPWIGARLEQTRADTTKADPTHCCYAIGREIFQRFFTNN